MTSSFPLSVSDHPEADAGSLPVEVERLDDLHDGFVRLKRREQSRLWFRMSDGAVPVASRPLAAAQPAPAKSIENPGTDKLVSEMVRIVRATRPLSPTVVEELAPTSVGLTDAVEARAPIEVEVSPMTTAEVATPIQAVAPPVVTAAAEPIATIEWRSIPAGAPVLLLSADPVLGSGRPGPILGPGMRYRITSMAGSVVGMEVMHANGDTRSGYANAVDLHCIEPRLQAGELQAEKGLTGRLRLTKLATTTFGLFGG